VSCVSSSSLVGYEDIGAWIMESGSPSHMTGMRSMFLSVSETCSNLYVRNGASTIHVVKGVGCIIFQLESGGSLDVVEVLFVPELKVNLLSIATLEDDGYAILI